MKHIRWIQEVWRPHRGWLWLLFLMTLLSSAVALAFPRVIGYLVDEINALVPDENTAQARLSSQVDVTCMGRPLKS